jgi:hypothetical protein
VQGTVLRRPGLSILRAVAQMSRGYVFRELSEAVEPPGGFI